MASGVVRPVVHPVCGRNRPTAGVDWRELGVPKRTFGVLKRYLSQPPTAQRVQDHFCRKSDFGSPLPYELELSFVAAACARSLAIDSSSP